MNKSWKFIKELALSDTIILSDVFVKGINYAHKRIDFLNNSLLHGDGWTLTEQEGNLNLPDDDILVLVAMKFDNQIYEGYMEGGCWHIEGLCFAANAVLKWQDLPMAEDGDDE